MNTQNLIIKTVEFHSCVDLLQLVTSKEIDKNVCMEGKLVGVLTISDVWKSRAMEAIED